MQSNIKNSDYVLVGKSLKAQGIKGEIKILPFSGIPADLLDIADFELRQGDNVRHFRVAKSRCQGKYFVPKFVEVKDRNEAETLAGYEVWVSADSLPELDDDEFYWHEMEGLQVVTTDGRELGRVNSLLATGAHDILVIKGGGNEYLVPAANDIIVSIDDEKGVLTIEPPPGLLEINEPDAL